jgi:hypothetical protein
LSVFSDTLETSESTGPESALDEPGSEILHYVKVSWPPGARELWYKEQFYESTGPIQASMALADSFEAFLEQPPSFIHEYRELSDHMIKAIIFESHEDELHARQEREETCQLLKRVLGASDPDSMGMKLFSYLVNDPGGLVEDACPEERLAVARLAADFYPDDPESQAALAEALYRSGLAEDALIMIDRALMVQERADSLYGWHRDASGDFRSGISDEMKALRTRIQGDDDSDR